MIQYIFGVKSRVFGILDCKNAFPGQTIDDARQSLMLFEGPRINAEMFSRCLKHRLRIKAFLLEISAMHEMSEKYGFCFHALSLPNV